MLNTRTRTLITTASIAFLSVICYYYLVPAPSEFVMSAAAWIFESQHGYFSHDSDPETWEFRATTRPGLGLVERSFATDDELLKAEGRPSTDVTQWQRFMRQVQHLNEQDPDNKQYKMFYVVRHGQGIHNVKEKEVGRDEWNVSELIVMSITKAEHLTAPLGQNTWRR